MLAKRQGVLAIAWDEVMKLPIEQQPPRNLKLQWALSAEQIEKRYRKQSTMAGELAQIYNKQGIKTIVLKGLAISGYYPIPEHRECGDLDCFLASISESGKFECRYEDGNKIAERVGAKVERDFYKHSHINYKGLMVENHAFCTAIRGSKERKALERHLQHLLATQPSTPIEGSHLLRPCADFNALFLTAHSFGHFLTEGIKLRHVLDWAYLLKAEQDNIDWKSFYAWCDRMHYTKFVDALTAISVKHLGLIITNSEIHQHSDLADKVLDDILNSNHSIHNTGASKFRKRLMIIRNKLFGGWKYRELYEKSAIIDTMQMVLAFFIERKPKI
ncbi:MAG: nucleotidyltransferase family protein [Alistipes sp.]|nr:nucleotidyltransferase family protein [Alistipes sp.]